ncbi:zinc metalloprotease [Tenacibaculum tangerinum]|uniref:Zinc metalloprotease n=1 Tax=Tenacibaculum tangerinum TaxID=3038772 RepID=A0ABY8KZU1_9FLAO|nr:zinc metalloprotease [Tenacibaculum tangerinum]WGH74742.1 zinc metalloprotease [Tenacibaculum tangerinum]
MKRIFLTLAVAASVLVGCQENAKDEALDPQQSIDMSDFYVETEEVSFKGESEQCQSMRVLNRQVKENPGLYKKMYDIEYATRRFLNAKGKPGGGSGGGGDTGGEADVDVAPIEDGLGIINIPVYIHIVYPNANSISDAQVNSQMATLNADFRDTNVDQLPSGTTFANDATDAGFSFSLAGVFRHNDPKSSWGTNDAVKAAYPPITPSTHMNIWVCEIGGGILGYAQFPGGKESTDGIVLGGDFFGNTGGVYGLGRTATHEVGHYLNLRHIWGDGRCRQDDFVADTPNADSSNGGCPTFPSTSCKSADMTMNYMDYTYDACMYMFTDGQRNRMRAIFQPGGARASMIN